MGYSAPEKLRGVMRHAASEGYSLFAGSDGGLVKTVRFDNPKYVGDPINAVRIFNEKRSMNLSFPTSTQQRITVSQTTI